MGNNNPVFSLKNFRSFGEEGADFELAPITVLTGCNSAGKSSLVKALLLLSKETRQTERGGRSEIIRIRPSYTLLLSTQDLALGRFDKVLNMSATNATIELSYKIWSYYLQETVKVTYKYKAINKDPLNNGALSCYTIEKLDGTTIYKCSGDFPYSEEQYIDTIRSNYEVFLAACEYYSFFRILRQLEDDKLQLSEDEIKLRDEMLELENSLKKRMKGHVINDFEHRKLADWNNIIAKRKEEKRHRIDDLNRFAQNENFISMREFVEKQIDELNGSDDDINQELYMILFCNEVIQPDFLQNVTYADSSSASIKRLYSIEDSNKLCNALRTIHHRKMQDFVDECYYPGSFMNKWIKEFDLGERIEIDGTEQGLGTMVFLKKKDGGRRLLADEGYGITQLVSLLLYIDNLIPWDPDISELSECGELISRYKPRYICVEEPENHLHPKFQSKLAEMFVEAYQKYNIHFIIETHSEYLIRKLQVMVADKENSLKSNDVSLNYVEKNDSDISSNRQIKIKEDGRLDGSFGKGFYDEAGGLSRQLFMLNS